MEDSTNSESTFTSTGSSDDEFDFAQQLRRQRKQVLIDKGVVKPSKPPQEFSQVLRQHREVLVVTWGEHVSMSTLAGPDLNPTASIAVPDEAVTTPVMDPTVSDDAGIGDTPTGDALMTALGSISFDSHDPTLTMDAEGRQQETPSRFLDALLAVNSVDADTIPDPSGDNSPTLPVQMDVQSDDDTMMFQGLSMDQTTGTPTDQQQHSGEDYDFFGEFSPSTTINLDVSATPVPLSNDNSMENGDHHEQNLQLKAPNPPQVAANSNSTDDAHHQVGLGDFNTAPLEQQDTSPTTDHEAPEDNHNDDFGDFDAAPSSEPAMLPTKDAPEEEDFGDFDTVQQSQPPILPSPDAPQANTDEFGDFGAAPSGSTTLPTNNTPENGNDDFGGFDTAPSQPATFHSTDAPEHDDDDDEFGDFDAAPSQPEILPSPDTPGDDDGDDDFGDFGTAPSEPATLPSTDAPTDADDDFGDFDAVPSQPAALPSIDAPTDADDDFGDFDAAPSQPATLPSTDVPVCDDDDFGDFDAAPSQPATFPSNDDDDDDFGDFDAAPSQPTVFPTNDATDNDDAFGDFDAAPSDTSTPTLEASHHIGSVVEAAKNLFSQLRTKYAFANIGTDNTQISTRRTVGETMISFESTAQKAELSGSVELMEALKQSLTRSNDTASTISLIIQNDGRNPYYQFGSPVGGLLFSEDDITGPHQSVSRVSATRSHIPDLLPIHLPSGGDIPLSVTSPKSKRKVDQGSSQFNGMSMPNLQVPSDSTKSNGVSQFIARIPDLSFMLESKLVLPTK